MDKFTNSIDKMVSQKRGFALLLTLSILSIIISLSVILVNYLSTVTKTTISTKAIIQGDILYKDIQDILDRSKSHKSTLYKNLYLMTLPYALDDNRYGIYLNCKPLANGININWLAYNGDKRLQKRFNLAQKVLSDILQIYNVSNPSRLEDLIYTNIRLGVGDRKKREILNISKFEEILFQYILKEDDKSVLKIPWDRYFVFNHVFNDMDKNMIDGNYLSAELISILFDMDIALVKESWFVGETTLKSFLSENDIEYNMDLFSSKFYIYTQCEVSYTYMGDMFKFTFKDIEDEVREFEFYGKK